MRIIKILVVVIVALLLVGSIGSKKVFAQEVGIQGGNIFYECRNIQCVTLRELVPITYTLSLKMTSGGST